jgi:hypothetical protein
MFICVCSLVAREGKNQFAPNLACLFPETRKRTLESQNSGSFQSSSPGKGGSCSSETKHDRGPAPRPKLFVSERKLQEQRRIRGKTLLSSIPGEGGFCCSETLHDRRTARRTKLFRRGDHKNYGHKPENFWVRVSVKMGLGIIIIITTIIVSMIFNDTYRMIRTMASSGLPQ